MSVLIFCQKQKADKSGKIIDNNGRPIPFVVINNDEVEFPTSIGLSYTVSVLN